MTEIVKYFSIIVFLASIIYMILGFLGESNLTKVFSTIVEKHKNKKSKLSLDSNTDGIMDKDKNDIAEGEDRILLDENSNCETKKNKNYIFNDMINSYNNFKRSISNNISDNMKLFIKIAFIVLATRILIYIFGYFAGVLTRGETGGLESIWVRWDAQHYLRIAREGYIGLNKDTEIFIVFYPLYPFAIRILNFFIRDVFTSSMILSNAFLVVGCFFMYRLFTLEYNEKIAAKGMKYLLFFPVSFFLCAPYTESLFIMLSVMMFYYLRKEKWFLSAIFGMLAGFTRFHGILLIIPFVIEFFVQNDVMNNLYNKKYKTIVDDIIHKAIFVIIIPMGFGFYLVLNKVVTGDWFKFVEWQSKHWGQKFKIFFDGSIPTLMDNALGKQSVDTVSLWIPQIVIIIVAFLAILYAIKIKMRVSYFAYMATYIFATISLSWLLSAPRYIMAAFPIYIVAAKIGKTKKMDIVLTFASIMFLTYCIFAYVNGKMIL